MSPTGYVLAARMIESYIDYIIRKNYKDLSKSALSEPICITSPKRIKTMKSIVINEKDTPKAAAFGV